MALELEGMAGENRRAVAFGADLTPFALNFFVTDLREPLAQRGVDLFPGKVIDLIVGEVGSSLSRLHIEDGC